MKIQQATKSLRLITIAGLSLFALLANPAASHAGKWVLTVTWNKGDTISGSSSGEDTVQLSNGQTGFYPGSGFNEIDVDNFDSTSFPFITNGWNAIPRILASHVIRGATQPQDIWLNDYFSLLCSSSATDQNPNADESEWAKQNGSSKLIVTASWMPSLIPDPSNPGQYINDSPPPVCNLRLVRTLKAQYGWSNEQDGPFEPGNCAYSFTSQLGSAYGLPVLQASANLTVPNATSGWGPDDIYIASSDPTPLITAVPTPTGTGSISFPFSWQASTSAFTKSHHTYLDSNSGISDSSYVYLDFVISAVPDVPIEVQGFSTDIQLLPYYIWDPDHPKFFSGTDCEILSNIQAQSGWIKSATMQINGYPVQSYVDNGSVHKATVGLDVFFDSTHFTSGSSETAIVQATDSNGQNYYGQVTSIAKNNALVLENRTLGGGPPWYNREGADTAATTFSSSNYSLTTSDSLASTEILPDIPVNTALYFDTHGDNSTLYDCISDGHEGGTIDTNTDIVNAISSKNGSMPPYNFVNGQWCHSMGSIDGRFIDVPYAAMSFMGTSEPSTLIDRIFVGWKNYVLGDDNTADWLGRFYRFLAEGNTTYISTLKSDLDGLAMGSSNDGTDKSNPPVDYHIEPYFFGDLRTKICGVYSGQGLNWYLVNSNGH